MMDNNHGLFMTIAKIQIILKLKLKLFKGLIKQAQFSSTSVQPIRFEFKKNPNQFYLL